MEKINVSIIGGSGYTGGELIRILLDHPNINISQVTSESNKGKFIHYCHPNLRKITNLQFSSLEDLKPCDLLFLCLPHKTSSKKIDKFLPISNKIIDLSADFRLDNADSYQKWYKEPHPAPQYLNKFVYGIPEIRRDQMKNSSLISSAGCNATATILGLYPLFKEQISLVSDVIVEVKVGSSEGGAKSSTASHHPIRSRTVRSFMPVAHRHCAEIEQELSLAYQRNVKVHFSATSVEIVRGVLATSHVFLKDHLEEKDIWQIYRKHYAKEPFIRIIKERRGNYRLPEPKILQGTNFCDIGFVKDPYSNRLVVISAIDNLVKGAAGQAVQAMNIIFAFKETNGLLFPGLHPI